MAERRLARMILNRRLIRGLNSYEMENLILIQEAMAYDMRRALEVRAVLPPCSTKQ